MCDVFAPQFELNVQLLFNCSKFLVASSWIDITETYALNIDSILSSAFERIESPLEDEFATI